MNTHVEIYLDCYCTHCVYLKLNIHNLPQRVCFIELGSKNEDQIVTLDGAIQMLDKYVSYMILMHMVLHTVFPGSPSRNCGHCTVIPPFKDQAYIYGLISQVVLKQRRFNTQGGWRFGTKLSSLIVNGGLKIKDCKIEGLLYFEALLTSV